MPEDLDLTGIDGTALRATLVPADAPGAAVVVVHGLGSRRQNHLDVCELLAKHGMTGLCLDLRGHGESGGSLDAGAVDDVVSAIDALVSRGQTRVGIRGSSLGGLLALHAATRHPAVRAVVAICPADPVALATRVGDWPLTLPPLLEAIGRPEGIARGYWHARGDEVVPWAHTFHLAQHTPQPRSLRIVMGGHHRSLQHDPDTMRQTVAFLGAHLGR
ncbi:MAG: alpha/beta fold hydrolase [Thermoleophilia bacterium]|nr:alpha/beta fold hydrolase [Thermoleophilia bacterium]